MADDLAPINEEKPAKGGEEVLSGLMKQARKARRFRPTSTKDKLSHKDLQRVIHGIPQELRVEIAKVFAMIDDDQSGSISMDELASMFRDLGRPQSTSAMKALFRVIDADSNGEVDFFEFQLMFWKLQHTTNFEDDDEATYLLERGEEFDGDEETIPHSHKTCKQKVWDVMETPSSSSLALGVSMFIMVLILLSTVMFLVESTVPPLPAGTPLPQDFAYFSELICVLFFSVELILRLFSTPNLARFFCDFMNVVDLVAILPWYLEKGLELSGSTGSGAELTIIRVVRLFRIFRLFKFSRYVVWIMLLTKALKNSLLPLAMVMLVLLIVVVIFASLMYTIERGDWDEKTRTYISSVTHTDSMFQSIMGGMYYGLITSTTVGYGDKYPVTAAGKFVGGIMCICGIFIMVIPISIFSNNFEIIFADYTREQSEKKETVATEELRQLLISDVPLSTMLAKARAEKQFGLDEQEQQLLSAVDTNTNQRPLRYATTNGSIHDLEPYSEFLASLTVRCHLIIDARRESLRILLNAIHKNHRSLLMMNVEDLFRNWMGVPLGILMPNASDIKAHKEGGLHGKLSNLA